MFHVELVKQEVLLLLPVATSLYFFSFPSLKVEGFFFFFFKFFFITDLFYSDLLDLNNGSFVFQDHENPPSSHQAMTHLTDAGSREDSDQAQKRLRT